MQDESAGALFVKDKSVVVPEQPPLILNFIRWLIKRDDLAALSHTSKLTDKATI